MVLDMRVVTLRGKVSFWNHFVKGSVIILRDVVKISCIFSFLSFLDTLFLYMRSCAIYRHTLYLFSLIYCWRMFFLHLPFHVLFLFSLYTHASYYFVSNLSFLFHTKMPWWVLFKVFQKYRLSKSTCHKLSSCKVFQEFVLG